MVAKLESKALQTEIISCVATLALELGKWFLLKQDPNVNLAHAPNLVHHAFEKCGNPLFACIHLVDSSTTMVDCHSMLTSPP